VPLGSIFWSGVMLPACTAQMSQEHQCLESNRSTLLEQVEHVRGQLTTAFRTLSEREAAVNESEQEARALLEQAQSLRATAKEKECVSLLHM
jgi:hypothetical protein